MALPILSVRDVQAVDQHENVRADTGAQLWRVDLDFEAEPDQVLVGCTAELEVLLGEDLHGGVDDLGAAALAVGVAGAAVRRGDGGARPCGGSGQHN